MKRYLLLLSIIILSQFTYAQEWINKGKHKKINGTKLLEEGNWLKKDRKKNKTRWNESNLFHIKKENGFNACQTISQRRDFYKWFDNWRIKKGHEIKWIGVASMVAGQFSKTDSKFIRIFVIRNRSVIKFANEGNKAIFNDVYKWLQDVYSKDSLILGINAIKWDSTYVDREQCLIVKPIYEKYKQDNKKIKKMAKGKGLYRLGVPKEIRFEGDVTDCEDRFRHGMDKLIP